MCQHFTSRAATGLAKNKCSFSKTQLGFLVCHCHQNSPCPPVGSSKATRAKCFRNLLSAHLGLREFSWEDAACCCCCYSFGECREQCDCSVGFGIGSCLMLRLDSTNLYKDTHTDPTWGLTKQKQGFHSSNLQRSNCDIKLPQMN